MLPVGQICLVIGTPRGFTRSVLEALLKRGSRVILACPDSNLGYSEHKRLSGLYGSTQISVSVVEGSNLRMLETLLLRALDTHGGVTHIVNSTADNKLSISRKELSGSRDNVENYLNLKQQQHEVQSIKDISKLAVKYLGKHNGFSGGSLINLVSRTELIKRSSSNLATVPEDAGQQTNCTDSVPGAVISQRSSMQAAEQQLPKSRPGPMQTTIPRSVPDTSLQGCCTVLGTTRALGLSKHVDKHGVRTSTVYEPNIDYPELSVAFQITDDEHSPYYTWNRYSAYCREYTGYMALHVADTANSGTAWRFNSELRLESVDPSMVPSSCKLANKMCYWLGCPHVDQVQEAAATVPRPGIPDSSENQEHEERQDN